MSSSDTQARVGQALVSFAVKSEYPDEEAVIAANVERSALPVALELLNNARSSLEHEIGDTSREVAPDVDTWITQAKALQDDIESSKRLANEIVRRAEFDEQRQETQKEQEGYVSFLKNEVAFNKQLNNALLLIQEAHGCLERAEALVRKRQVLETLRILEQVWSIIARIPASRAAQVVRLLDSKCFDLREIANDLLRSIWENLIVINRDDKEITINKELDGEATNLHAAMTSMIAYRKLEKEAKQFWRNLDDTILKARTNLSKGSLCSIHIKGNTICLGSNTGDLTIKSLFTTIEGVIQFLVERLPPEFIKALSDAMMPDLSTRIKDVWLDTAVPSSLDDMVEYQKTMAQVHEFVENLASLSWPGGETFEDWISDAPKIWLSKRREASLDWTRNQLAFGVGNPQPAEHIERRMVSKDEGMHMTTSGNMVTQENWDDAWESEEEQPLPPGTNRASMEEERKASEVFNPAPIVDDDDDAAEAWGWGDDDGVEDTVDEPMSEDVVEPPLQDSPPHNQSTLETRQVTLSESYKTSSLPQPVLKTITSIFNDAARLTSSEFENFPITPAAPGLFSLPTLVLASYRCLSPYYYAQHLSGNMLIYNDSIWLSDRLKEFQIEWDKRMDLAPRAYGKVKLDPEIKSVESFGKRAYTNELNTQRTVITDLLGGAQNFFQEDGSLKGGLEGETDNVIKHIRTVAADWKPLLAYSAWASSVGSIVNTIASKFITDIFDLSDVGVDEAERLASLISEVTKLDDLFLRNHDPKTQHKRNENINGDNAEPIPMTAQFVEKWMKLKYLSEVLQCNLNEIKYYWFESELSLHFTKDEVVDLIGLSFENNANVRQAIKEIKEKPLPNVQ